ncbi:MAG: FAD:protein FMN transferase [Eubacteriales bacterium]|nr:FAD:protein FMN transferase [Eubacteriales bacterium]
MKRKIIITVIAVCMMIVGCGDNSEKKEPDNASAEKELFAMDTYMTVTAYGENAQEAVDRAADEIERLDTLLSTGNDESETAQLNQNGGGELSEEAGYLVERSMELYQKTDGIFDIAIYPIMEAWGFTTQNYRVPSEEELAELLRLTDASKVTYNTDSREITFDLDGMKIDFGGIAKGYTSSRIMDIYRDCGIESGIVNLGGNVQVLGTKTDGSDWRVAIQSPDDAEDYLGVLEIQDKAVITSGGYERYFEQDGNTYHHIIDPATGYPAESGLISVTVVSEDGTLADGLSTSLFIMGKDEAVSFWREHSDEFDVILETEDRVLYVTEGIADKFSSEYQMEIIEK